jgi:GDP-L-fucose synthase
MPTNLYGPNDHYDLEKSHVLPALLRKFMTAVENNDSQVTVWGSGQPLREFLHVDDLADACLFLMQNISVSQIPAQELAMWNVGIGSDVSIAHLAKMIATITGFKGTIHFDATKPDGTPRKLMDVSRMNAMGWKASIPLEEGIRSVYKSLKVNKAW